MAATRQRWTRVKPGHYHWAPNGSQRIWQAMHLDGKVWQLTWTLYAGEQKVTLDAGWFATLVECKAHAEESEAKTKTGVA